MEFQQRFFREKAVKEYIQRQEKEYLPQFFSLQRIVLAYLVLFVFLLAGLLVWCSEVPLFITGPGFVLPQSQAQAQQRQTLARGKPLEIVLFLPARYEKQLRQGEKVEWQVEPSGREFPGTIQAVASRVISLEDARKLYALNGYSAQALASSSIEVILKPVATNMPRIQIGEMVRAQVQVGLRHIF